MMSSAERGDRHARRKFITLFGGAAVGGLLRDVFTVGALPIFVARQRVSFEGWLPAYMGVSAH